MLENKVDCSYVISYFWKLLVHRPLYFHYILSTHESLFSIKKIYIHICGYIYNICIYYMYLAKLSASLQKMLKESYMLLGIKPNSTWWLTHCSTFLDFNSHIYFWCFWSNTDNIFVSKNQNRTILLLIFKALIFKNCLRRNEVKQNSALDFSA